MRILAIDQSLNTSAAVIFDDNHGDTLEVENQALYEPSKRTGIHRLINIRTWLTELLIKAKPQLLVREMHNLKTHGAGHAVHAVSGFIDCLAYEQSFLSDDRYVMVPPTSWKKFCFGKGNLKKDTAYLMHVNKFLSKTRWLARYEGAPVVMNDNIGDAMCLGITAYAMYKARKELGEYQLNANEQTVLRKSDSFFDYGVE